MTYVVGIIKTFKATSNTALSMEDWYRKLGDRIDVECFDLDVKDNEVTGVLKKELFEQHKEAFYQVISDVVRKSVHDQNDLVNTKVHFESLDMTAECVPIFEEGHAEQLVAEPLLINFLFRNSTINNPLKGCILSGSK